jgi:hypothetical protein
MSDAELEALRKNILIAMSARGIGESKADSDESISPDTTASAIAEYLRLIYGEKSVGKAHVKRMGAKQGNLFSKVHEALEGFLSPFLDLYPSKRRQFYHHLILCLCHHVYERSGRKLIGPELLTSLVHPGKIISMSYPGRSGLRVQNPRMYLSMIGFLDGWIE